MTVVDGKGHFYEAVITHPDPQQCAFAVEQIKHEADRNFHIHIAIAPTKNADRLEWFVEKAVELGIDEISLLLTGQAERKKQKTDRLERKAVSAMKQSLKARLPVIHAPVDFSTFLQQPMAGSQQFAAYVSDTPLPHLFHAATPSGSYVVLIGPEGDFTLEEIRQVQQKGFAPVSLGPSRLRTETAGLAACHTLHLLQEIPAMNPTGRKT